jgi:hypothetical protein
MARISLISSLRRAEVRNRFVLAYKPAARLAARLGIFAILFQAILFGWHHHDLVFAHGQPQQAIISSNAGATQPADDEDGCEICQVLHHQAAFSSDGIAAPLPGLAPSPSATDEPQLVVRTLGLAFRARAPPSL